MLVTPAALAAAMSWEPSPTIQMLGVGLRAVRLQASQMGSGWGL
jgi:hypothetical protein